jgi:hypothetical protein
MPTTLRFRFLLACTFACLIEAGVAGAQPANIGEFVGQRIAALEQEQAAIRREAFESTQQQTVARAVTVTSANKHELDLRIPRLEAAIEQISGTRDELQEMRERIQAQAIVTGSDVAEEGAEEAAEAALLAGASLAARRAALVAGLVIDAAEYGNRWHVRYENVSELDRLVEQHRLQLHELYDVITVLYAEQGRLALLLNRLRALAERDRAIWQELAVLRDHQRRLAAPLQPAAPVLTRETDEEGDEALRAQARREGAFVGGSDPNLIRPIDLAGIWYGSGYYCDGPQPDEMIRIDYSAEEGLVATKIGGDACVREGEVTWRGTLDGRTIRGRVHLRAPGALINEDSWMEGTLEVVSRDEIRGFGVTYRRP